MGLTDFFGELAVRRTTSGIVATPKSSLQLSTYYACIHAISEDLGKMPIQLKKKVGNGNEIITSSPVAMLLGKRPSQETIPMKFKESIFWDALGHGNGYAEIVRDVVGRPREMHRIHPSQIQARRNPDTLKIEYQVWGQGNTDCFTNFPHTGRFDIIPAKDIFHLRGPGGDEFCGWSIIRFAAEQIGAALAAQKFGAAFFGNGAMHGGLLEHPGKLSKEAVEHLIDSFENRHKGSKNAFKVGMLQEGMKWTATSIPPAEAQFLETRKFDVVETARWFRMPLSKIQDLTNAHFKNVEQENVNYTTDTLMPWAVRFEEEAEFKLIKDPSIEVVFNFASLLRGDQKARSEYQKKQFDMGAMSPNEIRIAEGRNPDSTDEFFMQSSMMTVESIIEGANNKQIDNSNIEEEPENDGNTDHDDDNPGDGGDSDTNEQKDEALSLHPIVLAIVERVDDKERKAVNRALKKPDVQAWADDFYTKQEKYLVDELKPVFACAKSEPTDGLKQAIAFHYSERMLNMSKEFESTDLVNLICIDLELYDDAT